MARAPRSMSEWRRSPATGDWHVNAPERAHPAALRAGPPAPGATAFACPYCPGAEQLVAAALLEEADAQGTWLSRVVPSARPALRVEEPEAAPVDGPGHYGLRASTPGLGAHEIVVESRQHDLDLFDYAPADFEGGQGMGLPRYARRLPTTPDGRGVPLEVSSYPLPLCLRPKVLMLGKKGA